MRVTTAYFHTSSGANTMRAELDVLEAVMPPLIKHLYGRMRAVSVSGAGESDGAGAVVDEISQQFLAIWVEMNGRSENRKVLVEVS